MDIAFLTQQVVFGLTLGCLYALIAIGYTMVYGVLRLINFAHGDLLMVAAYMSFFGVLNFSLPWPVSCAASVLLTGLLGIMIDLGAYRPIRKSPRISALITAIGVSFLLENLGTLIIGGRPKSFPIPAMFEGAINLGQVRIPVLSIWVTAITGVLLVVVLQVIHRTRFGMSMRALSRDIETVLLMGVDSNRVISLTFFLGSMLAAVGGIMWCMKYPAVEPFMGVIPGLKAFVAAVPGE